MVSGSCKRTCNVLTVYYWLLE